jgi:transcriptional regulator with XRE-family HTH domain
MTNLTKIPTWTFGERLRKAREDAGLTQTEMAAHFRCGRSTIAGWEGGAHHPDYLALKGWAEVTDVPLGWIEHGDLDDLDRGITAGYSLELAA